MVEIIVKGLSEEIERQYNLGIELGENRVYNNILNILHSRKDLQSKKQIIKLIEQLREN